MTMAWHYTINMHAQRIMADGFIQPATAGVFRPEKPCVWFSSEPIWEQTACKMGMTFEDMAERLHPLWRFGLNTDKLVQWPAIVRIVSMPKSIAKGLVAVAHDQGADPMKWYASVNPVSVDDCEIQTFSDVWSK